MGRVLTPADVLPMIPQQEPFRFVDEILELGDEKVSGTYRWRPEADFYRGHFPGNPVTPGVLLVECMAQCSVVPLAIYLFHRDFDAEADLALQQLERKLGTPPHPQLLADYIALRVAHGSLKEPAKWLGMLDQRQPDKLVVLGVRAQHLTALDKAADIVEPLESAAKSALANRPTAISSLVSLSC